MTTSLRNYWINRFKLLHGNRLLRPLAFTYCITARCNLNCAYCEDFGASRNAEAEVPPRLSDALQVLRGIRHCTDSLIITGGEPLLYPDITPMIRQARQELRFRHITVLTNGLRLTQHEAILPTIDRLIISLDTTDAARLSQIIGASLDSSKTILENIPKYSQRQHLDHFQLVINCVLTPDTVTGAQEMLDFATKHRFLISFSPQAVHNWPHYDLVTSDAYKGFIDHLIKLKKSGAPILGSLAYLRTIRDLIPYSCYPTLIPRVMPNGELVFPCRPIEREKNSHGGRPCNLRDVKSWDAALKRATQLYGLPPRVCSSCYQQCYAEPSLMQAQPLSMLWELLRYAPSRKGRVWSHAPG
jgi:MoaA/NifB/PqqE/SkfB family radical SAM enzyme